MMNSERDGSESSRTNSFIIPAFVCKYWESQGCCCPVDIRTAHFSNMNAVQPYHCAILLVAKYCSDFRLPPWGIRGRRSSGVLRSVGWSIFTDVSWQTYQFHLEWVHHSENVDRYTNSAISVAQWTLLAIAFYRIIFPPYICSYLVFYCIPQVGSYPATLQRWVSFLENHNVRVPFFLFPLCTIRSNWHTFGFTQGETEEVAWRVEPQNVQSCLSYGTQQTWWNHVSVTIWVYQVLNFCTRSHCSSGRGISCRCERFHDQQHTDRRQFTYWAYRSDIELGRYVVWISAGLLNTEYPKVSSWSV